MSTTNPPREPKSFFLRNFVNPREAVMQMANVARFAAIAGASLQEANDDELAGLETVLLSIEDGLRELSESAAIIDVPIPQR